MSRSKIPNFSPEFRLETAKLVVDNGYTYKGAAKAMGVCYSNISKWVMLLNEERSRSNPKTESMTVDLIEIRELKKIIERLELEKDILKKATAVLISDSIKSSC